MLDESYYDGSRLEMYKKLMASFVVPQPITEIPEVDIHVTASDLQAAGVGTTVLTAFDPKMRIKKQSNGIIHYTLGKELDEKHMIEDVVKKVYADDLQRFMYFMNAKKKTFIPDHMLMIPPTTMEMDDGQLKIATDLILAVDDMIIKAPKQKNFKVLVIGSASPGDVERGGQSYKLFPYFGVNMEVDMYDPFEEVGSIVIERDDIKIVQNRIRAKRVYKAEMSQYDLVLDDSYVEGVRRDKRDKWGMVFKVKNYSVKLFPGDKHDGQIYHQKFRTEVGEHRSVSRDVKFFKYKKKKKLGTCAGCRELTMRVQGEYVDDLYSTFMEIHKKNCINSRLNYVVELAEVNFHRVAPFQVNFSEYCSVKGHDYFPDTVAIAKFSEVRSRKVVFSNRKNVLKNMLDADQILVIEYDGIKYSYYVSKIIKESLYDDSCDDMQEIKNIFHEDRTKVVCQEIKISKRVYLDLDEEFSDTILDQMLAGLVDIESMDKKLLRRKIKLIYDQYIRGLISADLVSKVLLGDPG